MAFNNMRVFLKHFNPLVQTKRFRGKINIQRPKPVHFERAVFMELTKPYFLSLNKGKKPFELCRKSTEQIRPEIDNPFQRIIAGELRDLFFSSRLIAFYHLNPMKSDQQFRANVLFKKEGMSMKFFGKKTLEIAVKGTKYESVLDFYVSKNIVVFSPELELKKLLKITKKFPQLVLLAAICDDKFINRDEMTQLSLIPNIQTAQASLVQTLNSAGVVLSQQLTSHQNTLVSHLQERIKQLEEEKK